eukprot:COSAG04_NODE_2774_length_3602_cov_5.292321_4_plen_172_part_00
MEGGKCFVVSLRPHRLKLEDSFLGWCTDHRAVEPVLTAPNAPPPSPSSATNFPRRMISPSAVKDLAQTATKTKHADCCLHMVLASKMRRRNARNSTSCRWNSHDVRAMESAQSSDTARAHLHNRLQVAGRRLALFHKVHRAAPCIRLKHADDSALNSAPSCHVMPPRQSED